MPVSPANVRPPPFALRPGVGLVAAVPFLYFGAQAVAAAFFPGFDPLRHTASQLGSDASTLPLLLNAGAIATGLAALGGAPALGLALARDGAARGIAILATVALASAGVAALWAGTHPLPDPRHNPGALGAGLFALPLLVPLAAWRHAASRGLRIYFVANLVAFGALAAVLGGATPVDPSAWPGLWQRLLAAVLHGPSAVWALAWLRRVSARPRPAPIVPSARGTT